MKAYANKDNDGDENAVTEDIPVSVPQHCRHARFAVDKIDSQSAPHRTLTSSMINEMWYTPKEIDEFKQDIRSIVIRRAHKGGSLAEDDEDEMAGLEKYSHQRSQYKKFAKYHTLNAQSKNRDPEFLRAVSRRFTAWATSIARDQGFQDYCAAYDPLDELLKLENFNSATKEISSLTTQTRIRAEESLIPPSSKRQRLSS